MKIFFSPVDVEVGEGDADDVDAEIRNRFLEKRAKTK